MASQDVIASPEPDFVGELRLHRPLVTAGQVFVSGLPIVVALSFLLSAPLADLAGSLAAPSCMIASLVVGLTLISTLELLGGAGEEGGTHVLVHQTLGGLGGFLAGWAICAGYAVLVAAMARAAAERILILLPPIQIPVEALALSLFLAMVVTELVAVLHHSRVERLLVLTVLLASSLLAVAGLVSGVRFAVSPPEPGPLFESVLRALAIATTQYLALEALVSVRQQMRKPRRDLPRAALVVLLIGGVLLAVNAEVAALSSGFPRTARLSGAVPTMQLVWGALAVVGLLVGAGHCFLAATRQLDALADTGHLPTALRRTWRRLRVRPLPVALVASLVLILVTWVPALELLDLAAGSSLVGMALLNAAMIYSHRVQPDRRRWFVAPFAPLLPGLAVLADFVLLRAMSRPSMALGALWILVGAVGYAVYGRHSQAAVKTAACVFGPEIEPKAEGAFRILVPVGSEENWRLLMNMATALACQLGGDVIPLQVIPAPDPLGIEEGQRLARERNSLFKWSTRLGAGAGVPILPLTRLSHSVAEGILDTAMEEKCDLVMMAWLETAPSRRNRMGRVLDPVVRGAPCDVAVLAYSREDMLKGPGEGAFLPVKCFLPTGGDRQIEGKRVSSFLISGAGPHAAVAVRLAAAWAKEYSAAVTVIYVAEPGTSVEELTAGRRGLEETAAELRALAGEGADLTIDTRVVEAEDVVQGVALEADHHDLVLLGASEESLIDQVLFGTVTERVARATSTPVIMTQRYMGLSRLWVRRLWDALYGNLPKLTAMQQADVYRHLRRGARPDVDFFIMMGLAAIIASMGLLYNSPAVIIGAMLVAPLFTPIVAISLAIVRGDARLLALATESTVKGLALAIGLGTMLAWLSPQATVTAEISVRAHPALPDLIVALASGAAGAYAIARKDVAASLPGVGIAAALVPPLCAVGIGLSIGDATVVSGAGLLFVTNLVAITLAGALMLMLLGFQAGQRRQAERALRQGLLATLALVVAVSIPLAAVFVRSLRQSQMTAVARDVLDRTTLVAGDVEWANLELLDQRNEIVVSATLYAPEMVSPEVVEQLSADLSGRLGRPTRLRLATIVVTERTYPPPG